MEATEDFVYVRPGFSPTPEEQKLTVSSSPLRHSYLDVGSLQEHSSIFIDGLHVFCSASPEVPFKFDIAEAPFCKVVSTKSLEGKLKISFNEESMPHLRCYFLTEPDEQDLRSCILRLEHADSVSVILLINSTSDIILNEEIFSNLQAKDFVVNVPVYTTSFGNGLRINDIIRSSGSNCLCQFNLHHSMMRKTLLSVFKDHLFPDNKDSVIVSEDKLAFQQIASALSSAELMKDNNDVIYAVKELTKHVNHVPELYKRDFIFLIYAVSHLLRSRERNSKLRNAINELYESFENCMLDHDVTQLSRSIKSFVSKENFELEEPDGSQHYVFDKLHLGITTLLDSYCKNNLNSSKFTDEQVRSHLSFIAKWTNAALKFIDISDPSCRHKAKDLWKKFILVILNKVHFTNKVLAHVRDVIMYDDVFGLHYKQTFVGSGCIKALLERNEKPRSFIELKMLFIHLHKLVKNQNEEFLECFCTRPFELYQQYFETKKRKFVATVTEERPNTNVTQLGFEYLTELAVCSKGSLYETVEFKLKEWISFLLLFLDLKDTKILPIIKEISDQKSDLFCSHPVLYDHFLREIQTNAKKFILFKSMSLNHFVNLYHNCKGIWTIEAVTNFFIFQEEQFKTIAINTEIKDVLHCFSSDSFRGAFTHKFLLENLLIPLSEGYARRNQPVDFVIALIQLEAPHLFEIRDCFEEIDTEIVESFKDFLKKHINTNKHSKQQGNCNFPENFQQITKHLSPVNHFKKIVLDIVAEKLCDFSLKTLDEKWLTMLKIIVKSIKLLMHSSDQYQLIFHWKIICGICKRIPQAPLELPAISDHQIILTELGQLNQNEYELNAAMANIPEIKSYICLANNIKQKLRNWKNLMTEDQEVPYTEIKYGVTVQDSFNQICKEFGYEDLVISKSILEEMVKTFIENHRTISSWLIKKNQLTLEGILMSYDVAFPEDILQHISDYFYHPSRKPQNRDLQILPESHNGSQLFHVRLNVTYKKLLNLVSQVKDFLGPLLPLMDFLEYFHIQGSAIFKLLMQLQLSKANPVTIHDLANALNFTKRKLKAILTGEAVYKDLSPYWELSLNFNDIRKEINIISQYKELKSSNNSEALRHFESVMIFQKSGGYIESLCIFCKEFELEECLKSPEVMRLQEIADEIKNKETQLEKKLSTFTSNVYEILILLRIPSADSLPPNKRVESLKFLELFEPLNTKTKELRTFLIENNFRGKGQGRFQQLHALVTQQLQHEEYNAEILTKLFAAYYLLVPLNNPDLTYSDLIEAVSTLDSSTCLSQIQAVNSNIDLIRTWFSRAEGDTVANTTAELHTIIANGIYSIRVSPTESSEVITLNFQTEHASEDYTTPSNKSRQLWHTWSTMDIQDFIRRLGFVEPDEDMSAFMKLNEMVMKLQKLMKSLHDMGHVDYPDSKFPYELKCSKSTEEVNKLVIKLEKDEENWSKEASSNRKEFEWLSFVTNISVIEIYKLMKSDQSREEIANQIMKQLLFLIPGPRHKEESVLKLFISALDNIQFELKKSPTEVVGSYLDEIFTELSLPPPPSVVKFRSYANLHQCHNYTPKKLIQYLCTINNELPKVYEILHCHSLTKIADVQLFFQRIKYFPRHYYFLQVDLLSSKLQEYILQQLMELYEKMKSDNRSTIHFIETSSSIFYEAPYINTTTLPVKDVQHCRAALSRANGGPVVKDEIKLVYGSQGNGKTHYIKKQLTNNNTTIAINEAFSISQVIAKLNSIKEDDNCSLYINITLLLPGDNIAPEERRDFDLMINKIGWFMFNLFVFGYVQDIDTGVSFSASRAHKWKVFIEVPLFFNDRSNNLEFFTNSIPLFQFVGTLKSIKSDIEYDIDSDVQLVCKYLDALEKEKRQPWCGINKQYNGRDPVRFGNEPDLSESTCRALLKKYLPKNEYMSNCKMSQKLFIKYMKRRCQFLEEFPSYNYNQGEGPNGADTRELGSTLMNAMLKEVTEFCDLSSKENWSLKAHQQLIYEGKGSIGLITLYPEKIPPKEREAFEKIKLEIPQMGELYKREVLDKYLARALSLPLSVATKTSIVDANRQVTDTSYKRLKIIDDNNYILTLDYALKMINIHERKECGMPVIIEGETGVGKTELLRMLSKLWNYTWVVQWEENKQKLTQLLEQLNKKKGEMTLEQQLNVVEMSFGSEESTVAGRCSEIETLKQFLLKLRKDPLISILQPKTVTKEFFNIPDMDETDLDTKTLLWYFRELHTADVSTFHKLDVHSGLKPGNIIKFFDKVIDQAERMQKMFGRSVKSPQVTAYLDEINTSSCMGLFKEIVVDRSIDGKPIPENIFIIAACNPLRGDSTAVLRKEKNVWHKPTYYVRELHPTIDYLKWDYGALDSVQEKEYVTAKIDNLVEKVIGFTSENLIHLIIESQKQIRKYAEDTLAKLGIPDAKRCSQSCVSQRDMQRVFDFYKWIMGTYENFKRYPTIEEQSVRAILVSLGVVYYLRLGERDRKSYVAFLNNECKSIELVDFTTAFTEELDWYIERLDLPPGIAKTNALKENVFANIICCQTHTPLIIIGEPGTSKTLSFNLVTGTFRGRASRHIDFKAVNIFNGLQPYFYQCSQHTNSNEVENLFFQATQRQKIYNNAKVPTYCVVFMDEAGLPEERHESLKALHYHLDKRQVSFVAITNHALDAAKTNRAISLYRPEASTEDLQILASDLLQSSRAINKDRVTKFCSSFSELMKNKKFKNFHGQRDFMHFLNYLKRRRNGEFVNEDIVLEALERNLNGHEDFPEVFNFFLKTMKLSYSQMYHRNILEIIEESIKDLPSETANKYVHDDESKSIHDTYTEHNVRYKLIIDNSEDESAVRYLFTCGVLNRQTTHMFACSDFPEESGMHINTISKIIHSAEQGHICLLLQTEKVHESFYELFNQRFRILDDPQKGLRLFTNISIGAHTKPCRIDSRFQCIVVIKKSELQHTPQAFLSRFEKFFFCYNTLYSSVIEGKPPNMRTIISILFDKVSSFVAKLQSSRSFYGYTPQLQDYTFKHMKSSEELVTPTTFVHETLHSLLLSLLPLLSHKFTIGCNIAESDVTESDDLCLKIIETSLNALRSEAGWNIPYITPEEIESDCKEIFQHLSRDSGFNDALFAPPQGKFDLKGAVGEALDAIHSPSGNAPVMGEDSCLVIAVIVNLLVRHVTKHLIHVLTPEALVVNENNIPKSIVNAYFQFQEHFSLKRLIQHHLCKMKNKCYSQFYASKLLIYTRHSHLFGLIPSTFPTATTLKDDTLDLLRSIVLDDLESLIIFKVLSDISEGEIERNIKKFMNNCSKSVFILIANMKDITVKMINYLRILIEQQENISKGSNKLVVLLLQFSQVQFFNRCYPVLFLSGWDHFYLDSLSTDKEVLGIPKPFQNVVDIRQCFRMALGFDKSDDEFSLNLQPLLEESIPVISSRVIVGSGGTHYNKSMSVSARQMQLKKLLIEDNGTCTPIGETICFLFHKYWDTDTITKFLQNASHFTFRNLSTISITSYIQTRIKALFFEFVVYILWKINADCNLDTYFSLKNPDKLFANVIKNLFFTSPSLSSLSSICCGNHNLAAPAYKGFQFPFFNIIFQCIEEVLDECQEIVGKKVKGTKTTKAALEQIMFKEMENKLHQIISMESKPKGMSTEKHHIQKALAQIISSLNDEELWQKYLQDFIKTKCLANSGVAAVTNDKYRAMSPVINAYFEFEKQATQDPVKLIAWVHVRSEVHKMDLAQTISKLQRLRPLINRSQLESSITFSEQSFVKSDGKDLGSFVISFSFQSLNDIVLHCSDERIHKLELWYSTYKDIVQIKSLNNSLHGVEQPCLKLQFFKVESVYSLIHFSDSLTTQSLKFALSVYENHISKIPDYCNIEDAFTKLISALELKSSENCSISFISSVVDKLLCFIFHSQHQISLCEWYIAALPFESYNSLMKYICYAQYRHYLLRMLKDNHWSCNTDKNDVLKLFDSEFRYKIGECISSVDAQQCIHIFESPTFTDIDTLARMYLLAVYRKICATTDITTMSVLSATTKMERLFEKAENCKDPVAKKLLILDREAYVHRFLHLLAYKLAHSTSAQELLIGRSTQKVDALLNREGLQDRRGLMLCVNLYNEIKNTEQFMRLLKAYPEDKLTCLTECRNRTLEYVDDVQLTFPLIIQKSSELEQLYTQTKALLTRIDKNQSSPEELKTFITKTCADRFKVDFSIGRQFEVTKKYAFRMCVWLCTYHEFYLKNKKSEHLAQVINAQMENIFPEAVIKLIISFLNSGLVEKQSEQNILTKKSSLLDISESYRFKPVRQGPRVDPIYQLFFPEEHDGEDIWSRQICDGLANMVAGVLMCPDQSTHLWYHLFSPGELVQTQITGYLLDTEITNERPYDYGILLNEEGEYGRPEYFSRAEKGFLNLHSLYFILWSNFGAFCLNLLTQPGSAIKGTVISDHQAIRHYCKSQMNSMWSHMNVNLNLNDQQLSLLVVRSMQRMIEISWQAKFCALLDTLEKRNDYEITWHTQIFKPSLKEVRTNLESFMPVNSLITKLRWLNSLYPYIPSLRNFYHYLQNQCISEATLKKYKVLMKFMNHYPCLKAGGILLPSLIEFYQWITTDLSYVITKQQASGMKLHEGVDLAAEKYSPELERYYVKLFEDVSENYNNYAKAVGFVIRACGDAKKEKSIPIINEASPLLHFLPRESSDEKDEQRDFLFLVIEDIVNEHNSFIKEMMDLISDYVKLQKYLSVQEESLVHPAAVNEYSCIIGKHDQDTFENMIAKYQIEGTFNFDYADFEGFNLDKIQEEIIAHYIAGKLKIDDCQTKLCKPFHFKLDDSEQPVRFEQPTELMLTLRQVDNIDDMFKEEIPEDNNFLIVLEYELFSLDYERSLEMAQGLKTITEHIKQKLIEGRIIKETIEKLTVADVLPELLVYDSVEKASVDLNPLKIFDCLGMTRLSDSHRSCIAAIPMRYLYTTLRKVVDWINDGIYDFHTLPKSMKKPLKIEDEEKLLSLLKQFDKTDHDELLSKLKSMVGVLIHCEQQFINHIDQIKGKNIFECMKDFSYISPEDNQLIKHFPKIIKTANYMILRVCLRKVINELEDSRDVDDETTRWCLNVEGLWCEDNLKHLRDVSSEITLDNVLDPNTEELYGFQIKPKLPEPVPEPEPEPKPDDPFDDDLSNIASKLNRTKISEYLLSLKLSYYVDEFFDNDIDGNAMFDITDEVLESLGVDTKRDRIKIKTRFKQWLRNKFQ